VSTCHGFALPGAAVTGIGATLAMIHVVLPAFLSAGGAYLSAQPAEFFGELRITGHKLGSEDADVRAIPIKPDASLHHLHVVLLQAGSRAVFTFLSALEARCNTTSILFVGHNSPSFP
jgi:hypothetical protein